VDIAGSGFFRDMAADERKKATWSMLAAADGNATALNATTLYEATETLVGTFFDTG